jgi:hypothetical protein
MNYLAETLKAGESWRYQPPRDHTVAWAAIGKGRLVAGETVEAGEMIVFAPSNDAINFKAETTRNLCSGQLINIRMIWCSGTTPCTRVRRRSRRASSR